MQGAKGKAGKALTAGAQGRRVAQGNAIEDLYASLREFGKIKLKSYEWKKH